MNEEHYEKLYTIMKEFKPLEMKFSIQRSSILVELSIDDRFAFFGVVAAYIDLDDGVCIPYSPVSGSYVKPSGFHRRVAELFNVKLADEEYVKRKLIESMARRMKWWK